MKIFAKIVKKLIQKHPNITVHVKNLTVRAEFDKKSNQTSTFACERMYDLHKTKCNISEKMHF